MSINKSMRAPFTIEDVTVSHVSRIPDYTYFRTTWDSELNLISYESSWGDSKSWREVKEENRDMQDKLAIARHRKELLNTLGLIEPEKPTKVIHCDLPYGFWTKLAFEKEKIWEGDDGSRMPKDRVVVWTEEKARLIKEYDQKKREFGKILDDIRKKIEEKA